ncbi:RNase H domain-containing protein [Aspergillus carlsbadensis]|nr:RNase H domain-containing protein [Aspergillus carlsbadensis]
MSQEKKQEIFTYADFNLDALCRRASTLRQGASCTCDPDQRPASGSFNWAVFIHFDDGTRWVFRSPHRRRSMPLEMGTKLLASEAAILLYLRAHSDIPAPELFDYCATSDNKIGIPFILMSEARGVPLSTFWKPAGCSKSDQDQDIANKANVLSQLGAITWKLSQLRLNQIGSLLEEQGTFHMTECLSRSHIFHERFLLGIPRGPFDTEKDFYDSVIAVFLAYVEELSLFHHCFVAPVPKRDAYDSHSQYRQAVDLWNDFVAVGDKIESPGNQLDYNIVAHALREIIQRLGLETDSTSFPLYHADLSANNIYVDDEYNITCIIDRAFASSIPEFMLLAPPGLPQFGDEISPDLFKSFANGFMAAIPDSLEKKSARRYQELLDSSQVYWRLTRLLSLDSIDDYSLFATVWDAASRDNIPTRRVERHEREYFDNKTLKYTIAKKLTLISEWNTQHDTTNVPRLRQQMFLADSRVWKSIMQSMQGWEDMR